MLSSVRYLTVLSLGVALLCPAAARVLPSEVETALERAKVPREALSVVVQEVGSASSRLSWQPERSVNPASLMKLVTTDAALDILGPAWTWTTPVWLQGTVHDGVLEGNLVVKGSGDPKLVLERVWLMLRRVQQLGVREIRGDIVLDRSAFSLPEVAPGDFDGEPLRPQNVQPDALLLNYRSILVTFTPDPARNVAAVVVEPPLAGVRTDATVPLATGPCDDWRTALKAELTDPARLRFAGSYSAACGERQWPVAYVDPKSYNERLLAGLWREMGGTLSGVVREGVAPAGPASFTLTSPALAELVRDINKFSNNVMAQQLFLTLGHVMRGSGTREGARQVVQDWLATRFGATAQGTVLDNGSGLSRESRTTAALLAQLLQSAWAGPAMPELASSLPVIGVDGTMQRTKTQLGRAHLKSGSLRDVAGIAGYVLSARGKRYVLVAVINHPNANAARPALEALVQWTAGDPRAQRKDPD
ncbi:MAG TPA: D-alanyl-D-alanine carboxypeptidase/D-alanyl-D-alanine-endopeptidase [Albitalea sp.]|uniref:D-alanyl-D-alanine carboxypeptidase/D-alanyl-D-alanine endopeptidase n=1 Tax=Piscinibacter sp. TaxID=1903157 RepID=UPI002ED1C95D